jgi:hypothetical protein
MKQAAAELRLHNMHNAAGAKGRIPARRLLGSYPMNLLLKEIHRNPMLWLLAFVPVVFAAAKLKPEAETVLFVLSVLAIVPLAGLCRCHTERPSRWGQAPPRNQVRT